LEQKELVSLPYIFVQHEIGNTGIIHFGLNVCFDNIKLISFTTIKKVSNLRNTVCRCIKHVYVRFPKCISEFDDVNISNVDVETDNIDL
jgi:hypothetical protein